MATNLCNNPMSIVSVEIQQLSLSLVCLSSNAATSATLSARISHVCHNLINLPQLHEALDHLLMNLSPQVDGESEPWQDAIDSILKLKSRLNTQKYTYTLLYLQTKHKIPGSFWPGGLWLNRVPVRPISARG